MQLIGVFMDKPSKKDYPDYYEIIDRPMDMRTINDKIKANVYKTVPECLADFRLMFANCMQYNEENSDIYNDAKTLDRAIVMRSVVKSCRQKFRLFPAIFIG
jgi:protein polybromo-1